MSSIDPLFHKFQSSIDGISLPDKFTYPFYYEPHTLCLIASEELQLHLLEQNQWKHNFGLNDEGGEEIGKMFGVLLVKNKLGEIGYLRAFSGKMAGVNHLPGFVPPVFDMLTEDSFFLKGKSNLNKLSETIDQLKANPRVSSLKLKLNSIKEKADKAESEKRAFIIEQRKVRKQLRIKAKSEMNDREYVSYKEILAKQSVAQRYELRDLLKQWSKKIAVFQLELECFTSEIDTLIKKRKAISASLQNQLFEKYNFLNFLGKEKNLNVLFSNTSLGKPPAAAGECAAPKLLQYAYKQNYIPLAIAEFWWGVAPNSAVRKHKNYYPACQGKCKPILGHMLHGLVVDENPLSVDRSSSKNIEVVHQDEDIAVIVKPEEFLSVPGKSVKDSVYKRVKKLFPNATGPLIVHRLDMSTSGVMLIALNEKSNKLLQKQFINRTVKKRYTALLDGILPKDKGIIELPLRVDLDDRPRQLVCFKHGKQAKTIWEVIERKDNKTKIYFYPITGRTHQLRVHAAHKLGLNLPIIGDDMYGAKAERLYLHAEYIEFIHPSTNRKMSFKQPATF